MFRLPGCQPPQFAPINGQIPVNPRRRHMGISADVGQPGTPCARASPILIHDLISRMKRGKNGSMNRWYLRIASSSRSPPSDGTTTAPAPASAPWQQLATYRHPSHHWNSSRATLAQALCGLSRGFDAHCFCFNGCAASNGVGDDNEVDSFATA